MIGIELKKPLGLLLVLFVFGGCEFGGEAGIVPVEAGLSNPVEGFMAVTRDQHVMAMDEVVNPDKSRVRTLKVFDREGELKMQRTENSLRNEHCPDCGAIVAFESSIGSFNEARETRFVALFENGDAWELVCDFASERINTSSFISNFVLEPNARLRDFAYVDRKNNLKGGATVFHWPGQGCGPLQPFLQWEPNRDPRQTVDLEPWLGCEPQYLRVASDENTKKLAVLGGDKVLVFRVNDSGPEIVVELENEVDLPARPDRVYADLAMHAGLIAVSERTTGGEANREHSIFLFNVEGQQLDQKVARKVNAIAFSTRNVGSPEVPVFIWYSGLDFNSEFNVMRRQVAANLD